VSAEVDSLVELGASLRRLLHQIKGELFRLSTEVQLACCEADLERAERVGRSLVALGSRLNTVSALRDVELKPKPARLSELLSPLLEALEKGLSSRQVALTWEWPAEEADLVVDAQVLIEIVSALLENAQLASGPGETIIVSAHMDDGTCTLQIADDGPGVPPSLADTLFDPFVTSRAGHLGIGLTVARLRAWQMGADLGYEPVSPRGTRMVLRLPHGASRCEARA